MERTGTFIVIEGTDGAGKATQFQLLKERLIAEGYDVAAFDFPQYDAPSSYFVRQYLNGQYGGIDEVGPYTASLFYALDRYEAAPRIRRALEQGKVVISNRFTGSSMGHQGTKFANAEQRRGFFIWLDNLEFEMLRIPRPDMSFILRVPADVAQSLVDQKDPRRYTDKKRDLHEADINHLTRAVAVFDDLSELFPKDFQRIDCVRDNQLLNIPTIQDLIWQKVAPMLPEHPQQRPIAGPLAPAALELPAPPATKPVMAAAAEPAATAQAAEPAQLNWYHVPDSLPAEVQTEYRTQIDAIMVLRLEMTLKLTTYLIEHSDTPKEQRNGAWRNAMRAKASRLLQPTLPVAVNGELRGPGYPAVAKLAQELLPANHADQARPLELVAVWPRNEADLVPNILYEHSGLPFRQLQETVSAWAYDRKLQVLEAYLQDQPTDAINEVRYSWDVLCDYGTLNDFLHASKLEEAIQQALTPRHGYEVPEVIEDAELTDAFEECFDRSLKLYSILQAAGFDEEAQYATLLGHRVRSKVTFTAHEAFRLYTLRKNLHAQPGCHALILHMHEKIAETHPLLGEAIAR